MTRALLVVAVLAHAAAAQPTLRLTHEPGPRGLRMRPRAAQLAPAGKPDASPSPPPQAVAREADRTDRTDPGEEPTLVRDVREPVSVRVNLGYVVDGTSFSSRATNVNQQPVQPWQFSQLHAYALGEGYFSTRGVVLESLSSYFAGRFQITRQQLSYDPNDPSRTERVVPAPIATWFERSGVEPRAAWAEIKDFLGDKRLAPLRLRAGELYVYGPWVLHMYGGVAAWDGKLVHATLYSGSRVPDYTLVDVTAKDRSGIGGASLRFDLRDLHAPLPITVGAEVLQFLAAGSADNKPSRHAQAEVDWRPRHDVALIGQARTLDDKLANEHVQLRSRYHQVTNLVFDLTHRHDTDWRWDPSVTETDPMAARRYLDLGPSVPQLLVSARGGTLIKENVDVYARLAAATDLTEQAAPIHNTYMASYAEGGGALEVRVRRTVALAASVLSRQTRRYDLVSHQVRDIPNMVDAIPTQAAPSMGERGFTEVGLSARMSLGARRFSALVEVYGRRTRYALDYCAATDETDPCRSSDHTGIHDLDYRGGGRVTVDAWIGKRLRLFASYELSGALDLSPELTGYKSLRLMMEGVY